MIKKICRCAPVFSIILLNACLSHADCAAGQVIVKRDLKAGSLILKRKANYSIILPDDYYQNQRTYPVIYLLHGFGGDNDSWLDRCNIHLLIDSLLNKELISDYIYVMPDAGNSYYINNYDSSNRYEDFFIGELIPHIDSAYRT
jgi:enterochelin esterase-like enzyme